MISQFFKTTLILQQRLRFSKCISMIKLIFLSIYIGFNEKVVYLTFDDGPSENTKKIMDILAKYDAKATFFVTGRNQDYNYLIKDAYNAGHTIALHTYSHEYSTVYASVDAYFDDLNKVGQMVKKEIGFVPHYIRFPGGSSNTVSRRYCQGIMSTLTKEVVEKGYQYYDWNGDSTDASGNHRRSWRSCGGRTDF